MTAEELRSTVERLLKEKHEVASIRWALQDFAKAGGTKEQAYEVLTEMRKAVAGEEDDDRLLDALDYVTGFCHPLERIWR